MTGPKRFQKAMLDEDSEKIYHSLLIKLQIDFLKSTSLS